MKSKQWKLISKVSPRLITQHKLMQITLSTDLLYKWRDTEKSEAFKNLKSFSKPNMAIISL